MQPLGLLGALLGGYQQGRLTKQNRDIRSAQLLRQQQENEALKKYRADSIELQKRRLDNEESPHVKATRDLFTGALKNLNNDFNAEMKVAQGQAKTADDLDAAMNDIYLKYNNMYKGLRAQHAASPTLQMIGDFNTISDPWVPDWVRSDTFDKSRYQRPYFNPTKFQEEMTKAVEEMTLRGITDPDMQHQFLDSRVQANSKLFGMDPERLWQMVPYTKPGTLYTGKTIGVETSPAVRTNTVDPSIPAFQSRELPGSDNTTTTFTHSIPDQYKSLGDFAQSGQVGLGNPNKPVTSNSLANEMMVSDLHYMFTNPNLRDKFGLTDVTNPKEFQKAIQIYLSPAGQQALQYAYNSAQNFGIDKKTGAKLPSSGEYLEDGTFVPGYDEYSLGNFGQSDQSKAISNAYRYAPLMAQTSRLTEIPVTQKYAIPLSGKDIQRNEQVKLLQAKLPGVLSSNAILEAKAAVAGATVDEQIAKVHFGNLLSAMRLVLDPLKYQLAEKRYNLDKWDDEFDNAISKGQLTLATRKFLVNDASIATGKVLQSADANLKVQSINLSSALQADMLASGVFDTNPTLKAKIVAGDQLTAEELNQVKTQIGPASTNRVRLAMDAYDKALSDRAVAYSAMQTFSDLGMAFSKGKPDPVISVPGTFNDPLGGGSGGGFGGGTGGAASEGGTTAPTEPTAPPGPSPRQALTAANKKPEPVAKPLPKVTSKVSTPTDALTAAQERFKNRGKGGKAGAAAKPPPVKPAGKTAPVIDLDALPGK